MRNAAHAPLVALLVCGAGCAYPATPRLGAYDVTAGYRFENVASEPADDEVLVVLAFSGGGTRAAALSYGVLDELRRASITIGGRTRSLLAEVDVISSVSGGSFTAAYYALNGEAMFEPASAFHRRFLYHPVQRDLVSHAFHRPANWNRLLSRVEIAAGRYAHELFGDATFADLEAGTRPYVILNATDMGQSARFEFTQEQFDLLCADLSAFPIARAVAASSAFPGLLNSMTVDTYNREGCGYTGPGSKGPAATDWVTVAEREGAANYRRFRAATELLAYRDPDRRHLHLLDGGLTDNVGVRSVIRSLQTTDVPIGPGRTIAAWNLKRMINNERIRHLIVIVANARTSRMTTIDTKRAGPGSIGVIGSTAGVPMSAYSYESMSLLREIGLQSELNRPGFPSFHLFEVAFENIADPGERAFFANMGTNFELDRFEVDCLIDRGARLLRESTSVSETGNPAFADVVGRVLMGSTAPGPPPVAGCNADEAPDRIATRSHYADLGLQYTWTQAAAGGAFDRDGLGMAFRLVRPNGFGVIGGYASHALDIGDPAGVVPGVFGTARLRGVSAGVALSRHAGRVEGSISLSAGYGFGSISSDAGRSARLSNAWTLEPRATVWFNATDRWALTASAGYVIAKPTLTVESSGSAPSSAPVDLSAWRVGAGVGMKIF